MKFNVFQSITVWAVLCLLIALPGCAGVEVEYPPIPVSCKNRQAVYPVPAPGVYSTHIWVTDDRDFLLKTCGHGIHTLACMWPSMGVILVHQDDWQCYINHEVGHLLGVNHHK